MANWTPEQEAMFEPILADLERRWVEDGEVGAVAEAITLCGWNDLRLPKWCVEPAVRGLELFAGQGSGKGHNTRASELLQLQLERHRHAMVSFEMTLAGLTRPNVEIYKRVAAALGKRHNVNWEAVQASYLKIKNQAK